jgi:hypothetical protein
VLCKWSISLYVSSVRGEPGGTAPLDGTLKAILEMSRKVTEWEHLSPYRGFVGEPGGRAPILSTLRDL